MATAQELLTQTETAISNCLTAQMYSAPGGRQKMMAQLATLIEFRNELIEEIANADGDGSMVSLLRMECPS